jgi:hypothetical protein
MGVLALRCAQAEDAAVLAPPAARAGRSPGAAGRVPLRHDGSLHCRADAATGGTPRTQFGLGQLLAAATAGGGPPLHFGEPLQALAAVAVRPSEPAVRAAAITAPAASRQTEALSTMCIVPIPVFMNPR